ncbi:MAG: cupin domain-containing protein [Gammaproteobacteria bacterium]
MSDADSDADDLAGAVSTLLCRSPVAVEVDGERRGRIRRDILQRIALATIEESSATVTDAPSWSRLSPLMEYRTIDSDPRGTKQTMLVRLLPGGEVPAHFHPRDEEMAVIEGEVEIGLQTLRAGDFHLAPAGSHHARMRSTDGAVLLLRYNMGTPNLALLTPGVA